MVSIGTILNSLFAMGDIEGYWGPPIAIVLAAFIIWLIIRKDLRDLKK